MKRLNTTEQDKLEKFLKEKLENEKDYMRKECIDWLLDEMYYHTNSMSILYDFLKNEFSLTKIDYEKEILNDVIQFIKRNFL